MSRERLDKTLVIKGLAKSREHARALIMAGDVFVNGQREDKAGKPVKDDVTIEVKGNEMPYVSRGGIKLAGALDALALDPTGLVCLDVGQSTGGFTDCLLQRGAARVIGVDVGYGQLALTIRDDPRVTPIERTNFRYFDPEEMPEKVDLVVIDVSFIGLKLILPVAALCAKPDGKILAMIKPQFEVGKGQVGAGGVVRDEALQKNAVEKVRQFGIEQLNLTAGQACESPITGPKGNREFFCLFRKNPTTGE
jgi:23S rRNA (cytidine1920-2'-O)/16S rRNA (cytidine1409-2'-O)-methyltransferase